jgi:hypothetical protein
MTALLLPLVLAQAPAVDYTPGGAAPPAVVGYDPTPAAWATRKVAPPAPPAGYPPAPAGFRWATYPDGRWGLVQAGLAVPADPPAAPGVAAVAPFAPRPAPATPATTAQPAADRSIRYLVSTPTGLTPTGAWPVGLPGGTNCAPGRG